MDRTREEGPRRGQHVVQGVAQASERLVEDAEARGANAVIGLHFQTSMIQQGAAEMLCYGTGVVVEADG